MNSNIIRALAKINLAIDITGKREDGYHLVDMVTIPLKLHDSIEISSFPNTKQNYDTYLYCDDPTIICDESNLAYEALNLLRDNNLIKGNYRMWIHKRIPVQAGLGGGSADAAAVIVGLRAFAGEEIEERLKKEMELAVKIGADVPFCILNKPSRVQGIGEKLTEIKVKYPYNVLIVKPDVGLATKTVYQAYDLIDEEIKHPDINKLIKALEEDDEKEIENNMINVLSIPAIKALPLIQDIIDKMRSFGLKMSGMSGSGSACFALSKEKKDLDLAATYFTKQGYSCFVTQFAVNN